MWAGAENRTRIALGHVPPDSTLQRTMPPHKDLNPGFDRFLLKNATIAQRPLILKLRATKQHFRKPRISTRLLYKDLNLGLNCLVGMHATITLLSLMMSLKSFIN